MNDKGDSSTPPIYDQYPCVTHANTHTHAQAHTHTHTLWAIVAESIITLYCMEKRKRESLSDECYKDSNPVKGDTQPNMEMHLYRGEGGRAGGGQ